VHAPRQKLRVVREVGVSADRSQLSHARRYAEQAAAAFGLDPRRSYEFVYAVNEAVTNAIRHGAPDAEGMIRMSVHSDENLLTLTVRDCGTFAAGLPARAARGEHGRGLALMARFTDELSLTITHGATVVSLSKARA
jgi:anti-sigma regulatory factor (Ser/Thr protein kinase)